MATDHVQQHRLPFAVGRRLPRIALGEEAPEQTGSLSSAPADSAQRRAELFERGQAAPERVVDREIDRLRSAHRAQVEEGSLHGGHGNAVDGGDVVVRQLRALVHDQSVVLRSTPARTRDLDGLFVQTRKLRAVPQPTGTTRRLACRPPNTPRPTFRATSSALRRSGRPARTGTPNDRSPGGGFARRSTRRAV